MPTQLNDDCWHYILQYLRTDYQTLGRLLCTSKSLFSLAVPVLYHNLFDPAEPAHQLEWSSTKQAKLVYLLFCCAGILNEHGQVPDRIAQRFSPPGSKDKFWVIPPTMRGTGPGGGHGGGGAVGAMEGSTGSMTATSGTARGASKSRKGKGQKQKQALAQQQQLQRDPASTRLTLPPTINYFSLLKRAPQDLWRALQWRVQNNAEGIEQEVLDGKSLAVELEYVDLLQGVQVRPTEIQHLTPLLDRLGQLERIVLLNGQLDESHFLLTTNFVQAHKSRFPGVLTEFYTSDKSVLMINDVLQPTRLSLFHSCQNYRMPGPKIGKSIGEMDFLENLTMLDCRHELAIQMMAPLLQHCRKLETVKFACMRQMGQPIATLFSWAVEELRALVAIEGGASVGISDGNNVAVSTTNTGLSGTGSSAAPLNTVGASGIMALDSSTVSAMNSLNDQPTSTTPHLPNNRLVPLKDLNLHTVTYQACQDALEGFQRSLQKIVLGRLLAPPTAPIAVAITATSTIASVVATLNATAANTPNPVTENISSSRLYWHWALPRLQELEISLGIQIAYECLQQCPNLTVLKLASILDPDPRERPRSVWKIPPKVKVLHLADEPYRYLDYTSLMEAKFLEDLSLHCSLTLPTTTTATTTTNPVATVNQPNINHNHNNNNNATHSTNIDIGMQEGQEEERGYDFGSDESTHSRMEDAMRSALDAGWRFDKLEKLELKEMAVLPWQGFLLNCAPNLRMYKVLYQHHSSFKGGPSPPSSTFSSPSSAAAAAAAASRQPQDHMDWSPKRRVGSTSRSTSGGRGIVTLSAASPVVVVDHYQSFPVWDSLRAVALNSKIEILQMMIQGVAFEQDLLFLEFLGQPQHFSRLRAFWFGHSQPPVQPGPPLTASMDIATVMTTLAAGGGGGVSGGGSSSSSSGGNSNSNSERGVQIPKNMFIRIMKRPRMEVLKLTKVAHLRHGTDFDSWLDPLPKDQMGRVMFPEGLQPTVLQNPEFCILLSSNDVRNWRLK